MSSSSTSFDRYYEEFQSLTEQVSSKLSSLSDKTESVNDGASSSSKQCPIDDGELKIVQDLLLQADDIIKQMGLEARSVNDNGTKKELLEKVRNMLICHCSILSFIRSDVLYNLLTKAHIFELYIPSFLHIMR